MININLLPKDLRRQSGPDYWKVGSIAVVTVPLLTIGFLQFSVNGTLDRLNKTIEEHESEMTVLRPKVQERNKLMSEKQHLEAITSVAATLKAGQSSWSGDLARFVRQLPTQSAPTIALNSLSMRTLDAGTQQTTAQSGLYDGKPVTKEVQLSGKAASSAGFVQFVNAFENAKDFGVQFQNLQRNGTGGGKAEDYSFAVTIGMVGSRAPEPTKANATAQPDAPVAVSSNAPASGGEQQ